MTTLAMMAWSSMSVSTSRTNERSIFSFAAGNALSRARVE